MSLTFVFRRWGSPADPLPAPDSLPRQSWTSIAGQDFLLFLQLIVMGSVSRAKLQTFVGNAGLILAQPYIIIRWSVLW